MNVGHGLDEVLSPRTCPAKREDLQGVNQNLVLTVLHVPCPLDSGTPNGWRTGPAFNSFARQFRG